MSISSTATTSAASIDDYYCPIAGAIMGTPVQLPCCNNSIDLISLEALANSRASAEQAPACPLCRHVYGDNNDGDLTDRVRQFGVHTLLRDKIQAWVNADPIERYPLVIRPGHFQEISKTSDPAVSTAEAAVIIVPGLLEALSGDCGSGGERPLELDSADLNVRPTDAQMQKKRDFLKVFSAIWQEIPYDLRGAEITAASLEKFEFQANAWLRNPHAKMALSSITTLNLSGLGLKSLPHVCGMLSRLRSLDISENQIDELPVLCSLVWLNARNNKIQQVRGSIANMTLLKALYLSRNPITDIDLRILELPGLQTLECLSLSSSGFRLPLRFFRSSCTVYLDAEHDKKWKDDMYHGVTQLLNIADHLQNEGNAPPKGVTNLDPFFKESLKTLFGRFEKRGNVSTRAMKADIYRYLAMDCIGWLYNMKGQKVDTKQLVLRLPSVWRNQVYGMVYQALRERLTKQKVSNPRIGEEIFLGTSRIFSMTDEMRANITWQTLQSILAKSSY